MTPLHFRIYVGPWKKKTPKNYTYIDISEMLNWVVRGFGLHFIQSSMPGVKCRLIQAF